MMDARPPQRSVRPVNVTGKEGKLDEGMCHLRGNIAFRRGKKLPPHKGAAGFLRRASLSILMRISTRVRCEGWPGEGDTILNPGETLRTL